MKKFIEKMTNFVVNHVIAFMIAAFVLLIVTVVLRAVLTINVFGIVRIVLTVIAALGLLVIDIAFINLYKTIKQTKA